MFNSQLGYALVVESTFARLVKAPLPAAAPVRAARRGTGETPFTARTYVLLSLACGALLAPGVGEQILISALVDQIRADAAEQAVTVTDGISDRRQLVAALKLLVAWGVVTETDGTLTGWGERPRTRPCSPSTGRCSSTCCPARCTSTARPKRPGRALTPTTRRRLRQRLVESPAVFRAELPDDELDVLSRERTELARHLDENFGLVLEVRAEGALAYDPASGTGGLTDIDFPGSGSAKQAALLLLDELGATAPAAGQHGRRRRSHVPGHARALDAGRHGARRAGHATPHAVEGRLRESPDILRTEVVALLTALRLAKPTDGGLAVFPFAARYQPQVTIRSATEQAAEQADRDSNEPCHGSHTRRARPAGSTSAGGCPGPASSTSGTTSTTSSTSAAAG